jgi:hypothetical protein
VARYRATKQTELPYPDQIPVEEQAVLDHMPTTSTVDGTEEVAITTSSQLEGQPPSGSLRRRQQPAIAADSPVARALKRVGSTVLTAHAQDYERRRPAAVQEGDSDEDEGEEDEESDRED